MRVYHNYKVIDKVMLNDHIAYKYETPYKGVFVITKCWINGRVKLQCGAIQVMYNTHHIKPYKYHTNVKDINPETND